MIHTGLRKQVSGVYAAVLTPRDAHGKIDEAGFGAILRFLLDKQIRGFAINGATGEYCLTSADELRRLLAIAQEVCDGRARILCGVGSADLQDTLERCAIAAEQCVQGLLLPMPYFFPYSQDDLQAFSLAVAERVELPILLYNLPFTSLFEASTVQAILARCPNVIGIKDSSGSLEILSSLAPSACRIVGSDGVLAQALREHVCDGVISGVACVLPELIQSLFEHGGSPESPEFAEAAERLDEFIAHIEQLPVPWGLKWIAEARGVVDARFAQPLSASRRAEGESTKRWLRAWLEGLGIQLGSLTHDQQEASRLVSHK